MTSTTSCFLPAASRAGTPAYSPDTATPSSASSTTEAPRFDELCPEEQGGEQPQLQDAREAAEPVDTADEPEATPHEETSEADSSEPAEDPAQHPVPPLEAPTIIQTLLASLCDVTPAVAVAVAAPADPAENAATTGDTSADAAAGRPARPGTSSATAEAQMSSAAVHRASRAAGQGASSVRDGKPATGQPSEAASARATDPSAPVAASPVAVAARAKSAELEDTSAQPVLARIHHSRGPAEKSAGQPTAAQLTQVTSTQNKFLSADNQDLTNPMRTAGTRSALSAAPMNSSKATTALRSSDAPVLSTASQAGVGQTSWTEALSVDWKGWTNGGGERTSTAAQFSHLGEKLNHVGLAATPATPSAIRAATPVQTAVPVAPVVPVEASEALAPIHSAIERLVLHGRDQLALTVRFEQGGSLSIKLAMNQGEISTQIQTDVPGLEAALKSSWGELAQDWSNRGWRLANPEITSQSATYHQRGDAMADGRESGRQARGDGEDTPSFGSRAFSPARLKHSGAATTLSGLDALRAAALARRGIHTWA